MTTPFNLVNELEILAGPDFSQRNLDARIAIMEWMRVTDQLVVRREILRIPTLRLCRTLESVGVRRIHRDALIQRCAELQGGV